MYDNCETKFLEEASYSYMIWELLFVVLQYWIKEDSITKDDTVEHIRLEF